MPCRVLESKQDMMVVLRGPIRVQGHWSSWSTVGKGANADLRAPIVRGRGWLTPKKKKLCLIEKTTFGG